MKNFYLLFLVLFIAQQSIAQGTIMNINMIPTNPTSNDSITFYVESSFSSGGCPLSSSGVSLSGNTVKANSTHCLGFLAVICPAVDTFKIAPLQAGNYTFQMDLSSGSGLVPCTPGFAPDDSQTTPFTVTSVTSIEQIETDAPLKIFPNPASDYIRIENKGEAVLFRVYNSLGTLVLQRNLPQQQSQLSVKGLANGLYYYQYEFNNKLYKGTLVIN